ncbi:MAG: hypothetical protein K8I00_05670, partial [Candidatus Omnitrophica bacterium]|nr:hypothetical protein [Candidatus Omnitrophota bacterium]
AETQLPGIEDVRLEDNPLALSTRVINVLKLNRVITVKDLTQLSLHELRGMPNLGPTGRTEIIDALANEGLTPRRTAFVRSPSLYKINEIVLEAFANLPGPRHRQITVDINGDPVEYTYSERGIVDDIGHDIYRRIQSSLQDDPQAFTMSLNGTEIHVRPDGALLGNEFDMRNLLFENGVTDPDKFVADLKWLLTTEDNRAKLQDYERDILWKMIISALQYGAELDILAVKRLGLNMDQLQRALDIDPSPGQEAGMHSFISRKIKESVEKAIRNLLLNDDQRRLAMATMIFDGTNINQVVDILDRDTYDRGPEMNRDGIRAFYDRLAPLIEAQLFQPNYGDSKKTDGLQDIRQSMIGSMIEQLYGQGEETAGLVDRYLLNRNSALLLLLEGDNLAQLSRYLEDQSMLVNLELWRQYRTSDLSRMRPADIVESIDVVVYLSQFFPQRPELRDVDEVSAGLIQWAFDPTTSFAESFVAIVAQEGDQKPLGYLDRNIAEFLQLPQIPADEAMLNRRTFLRWGGLATLGIAVSGLYGLIENKDILTNPDFEAAKSVFLSRMDPLMKRVHKDLDSDGPLQIVTYHDLHILRDTAEALLEGLRSDFKNETGPLQSFLVDQIDTLNTTLYLIGDRVMVPNSRIEFSQNLIGLHLRFREMLPFAPIAPQTFTRASEDLLYDLELLHHRIQEKRNLSLYHNSEFKEVSQRAENLYALIHSTLEELENLQRQRDRTKQWQVAFRTLGQQTDNAVLANDVGELDRLAPQAARAFQQTLTGKGLVTVSKQRLAADLDTLFANIWNGKSDAVKQRALQLYLIAARHTNAQAKTDDPVHFFLHHWYVASDQTIRHMLDYLQTIVRGAPFHFLNSDDPGNPRLITGEDIARQRGLLANKEFVSLADAYIQLMRARKNVDQKAIVELAQIIIGLVSVEGDNAVLDTAARQTTDISALTALFRRDNATFAELTVPITEQNLRLAKPIIISVTVEDGVVTVDAGADAGFAEYAAVIKEEVEFNLNHLEATDAVKTRLHEFKVVITTDGTNQRRSDIIYKLPLADNGNPYTTDANIDKKVIILH